MGPERLCSVDERKASNTAVESVERLTNVVQEEVCSSHASWTILSPDHVEESTGDKRFHAWLKSSEECVEAEPKAGEVVVVILHGSGPNSQSRGRPSAQRSFRASLTVEPASDSPVHCPSSHESSNFQAAGASESTVCCSDIQDTCTINMRDVWSSMTAKNSHNNAHKCLPLDSAECMAGKMGESKVGCDRQSISDSQESVLGYTVSRGRQEKEETGCIKVAVGLCHGRDEESDTTEESSFTVSEMHQAPVSPEFPQMMEHKPSVGARSSAAQAAILL